MAVTLQDVADRAGVAVGTVFRYINGAQLREKNRQKVERAIKELGFKEQVSAIAVLVPELTQLFAMTIVTALEQYLARERFNILLCDFGRNDQQLQERLKFFKNRAISGIVLVPQVFEYKCLDLLKEYRDEGIPIVLIDEINVQMSSGKDPFQAVVDSGVSRVRPVSMAAATTVLGMIPLLADAFFVAMAVTIMVGLTFATVLTLVVVPVLYTCFFKIQSPKS